MENVIAGLLKEFEQGKMSRRQLIKSLALAATAAAVAPNTEAAQTGKSLFTTIGLDHIDYRVKDYAKTRDFYIDIMGMVPMRDNGKSGVDLMFGGNSRLIARNHQSQPGQDAPTKSEVNHLAFWIDDWNTDRLISELKKKGHEPKDDGGGYASYHINDPDGFDLQISGLVKPGDSLYGKKLSEYRKVVPGGK